MNLRDQQWTEWLKKHGPSDQSVAAFLSKYPPDPTYVTCGKCGNGFTLTQDTIRLWPDSLWPGKVQAWFRCPKMHCLEKSWMWAHDLPAIWQCLDVPAIEWEKHALRRLLYSCELHGIKPLPEPIAKAAHVEQPGWFRRFLSRALP